jgi:hypothetical protein
MLTARQSLALPGEVLAQLVGRDSVEPGSEVLSILRIALLLPTALEVHVLSVEGEAAWVCNV